MVRYDYSAEAWKGPPARVLGWWKSLAPAKRNKQRTWAPSDVMLDLFDRLAEQPDQEDLRYVLTLLMIRHRIMRLVEREYDEANRELMVVACAKRETTYKIASSIPSEERIKEIQTELTSLLSVETT